MINITTYTGYKHNLLAGDRFKCKNTVQTLLDNKIDIKELYTDLFQRSMYEVGELWENNRISVANEHLATAITESLLNLVYPHLFAVERIGKSALISCTANEYHQVGGKMIADVLEMNGWDGYFLGANTPNEDMARFIDEKKPDLVGLSLSILSNIKNLEGALDVVRTDFPTMDLLVGGQAFRWGGLDVIKKYQNTEYISTLNELETVIKNG